MRTISTRTILSLLFIFGFFFLGLSQNTYLSSDKYPKWRLGLNMGGTWQTSDIKKNYAGLAGGFNIERILNRREDAPIGFSLGFRYLSGNSTGYDNTKNTAIQANKALNGTYNSIAKYDSTPGYFYNNYFTHLAEGNLELKINFPAMEKRTRFIFHVFSGVGATKYKTRINALDDSTHVYDFSTLPAAPSVSNIKSFYNGSSGTFETLADGNNPTGTFVFTPSLGLGVGFRISKNVAFVIEHKVSFPITNTLDGQQYATSSSKPLKNDIYHYTAANLIFTIWGKHRANYTNTHPNTTTTNTTTTNQTDPNTYTTGNNQPKPIISIYSPTSNPYTTTNSIQQVTGVAQYVASSNNLSIAVNGYPVNNFTFNPNNGSFSFGANLSPGNNNVSITGSNAAGQDNEALTINYSTPQNPVITNPVVSEMPPKVIITYPSNNYSTTSPSVNINATITNVTNSSNIAISANGYAISNFNFNPYNGSVSFVAPLIQGNNSIIVSAFNTAGNDAQQVFVNYKPINITTPVIIPTIENKPVVSFNNPSVSPFQSITSVFYITAKVTNVSSASQVSVQYNGLPVTNFTFNQYGFVNFTANLNNGSNTVVITGTNNAGSDTKTATVNYQEAGMPPVVTIINPTVNPSTTNAPNANVIATVTNVNDQNNISVYVNNTVSQFTYNTSNHTVTIPVALNVGSNTIKISASTNFGSDSKTQTIERKKLLVELKPVITVLNPAVNPFATGITPASVLAQVMHVSSANAITVKDANNNAVPFTYNGTSQQIVFSPNLLIGANTFVITATNTAGSDTKSLTINYTVPTVSIPLPPTVTIVNPSSNPMITSDAQAVVKATTTNVLTQQEVTVSVNGNGAPFTFNTTTKEVEVPVNLSLGTNTITITASNQGGSDSKTQIIERFTQPKILLPIVTILNPQTSPFLSPTQSYSVTAEVLNVSASSDISVMQGSSPVPFTYDNVSHLVNFNAALSIGSKIYTIKGTNTGGSDSKTVTLNYVKTAVVGDPTLLNKPVVTITTPATANSTVNTSTQNIVATVTNVTQASQVNVLVNGIAIPNFTFSNGNVSLTANLNLGNNTVTVTGTNVAGSDSKTVSVVYNKIKTATDVDIQKPVVTITTPATANSTVNTSTQNIVATVTNVTQASQVNVLVNGIALPNFTFSNGNVSLTANLNLGNNTVTVTGTNVAGSDSKTVSVVYNKIKTATDVDIQKPVVTITTPATANSTVNTSTQNIVAIVTNVTQASQVNVLVNGIAIPNFTFSNGNVSLTANLNLGNNTVTVTGTNLAGSDSKTVSVVYNKIKTATDVDIQKPVVIITAPATANSTVNMSAQNIVATVTNVTQASQVNVLVNGIAIPNFTFSNGNVSLTANLNLGNNTVTVTGTNVAGSDSKTVSIVYNKVKTATDVDIQKPVVIITTPALVNSTVNTSTQNIVATVTNVTQASQVNVLVNGIAIPNFTFSNGNVSLTANLNLGNNTVTVTGTNVAGSDSKTVSIVYNKVKTATDVDIQKPVVIITTPALVNSTVNTSTQNIVATVTNVTQASQVNVLVNGIAIPNFTFSNGNVSLTANLNLGNNTVTITGTNLAGSDSKTVSIVYNKVKTATDADIQKPVVTITSSNSTTGSNSQAVSANITNINSSGQVTITLNGAPLTTFTYSNGNVSFNANLNYGSNEVIITGTNIIGSDSKTVNIFRKTPPGPSVTITKPTTSPSKTNKRNVSVIATVLNVASSNEISIVADNGGAVPFTYNSTTFVASFEYNLTGTYTTFTVSATNAGGSDSKTVTFKYEELAPAGTTDLITICHYPNGPNSTPQTMQIPTSDWATHQAHGDTQGACVTNGNGNNGGGNNGGGKTNTGTTNPGNGGSTTTPKTITPNVETTPKTTTPQTTPKTTPKVESTPKTAPTTTPKVESTPKTTTPTKESTPKVIQPTAEETQPTTTPAPRTIKPK